MVLIITWNYLVSLFVYVLSVWQPTPVLLLGKFHGCRSLVGAYVANSRTQLSDFPFSFLPVFCTRMYVP